MNRWWSGVRWGSLEDPSQDPYAADAREMQRLERQTKETPSMSPQPSSRAVPTSSQRRFVGDAGVGQHWSLSQVIDAVCYIVTGIVGLIAAAQPDISGWMALVGLGAIAYGAKILLVGGTYWVSVWVYVVAAGAIFYMFGLMAG